MHGDVVGDVVCGSSVRDIAHYILCGDIVRDVVRDVAHYVLCGDVVRDVVCGDVLCGDRRLDLCVAITTQQCTVELRSFLTFKVF